MTDEPTTAAGRQHVGEFDVGQFGRVKRAVLAIEAEARAQGRAEALAAVERAAHGMQQLIDENLHHWLRQDAVLAAIAEQRKAVEG